MTTITANDLHTARVEAKRYFGLTCSINDIIPDADKDIASKAILENHRLLCQWNQKGKTRSLWLKE